MRNPLGLVAIPFVLLVACSDTSGDAGGAGGGGGTTSGGKGGGGSGTAGTSNASGGMQHAGAGTGGAATGGSSAAGKGGGAGAASGTGGASGSTATSAGTSGSGTSEGGEAGMPGGGSGGSGGAATGGNPTAGSGNAMAGTGNTGECTRELMQATLSSYFTALAAHDPSTLPLADGVKFTENGEVLELGKAGLWTKAGAMKYVHSAFDTDSCNSASQAVVPDGSTDIPLGLRIKLVSQKITEIETIAVRSGDYSLASNTAALAASDDTVHWEQSVPEADRNTHAEITAWMNKYFRLFPAGVCNTASGCTRLENGGGSFSCSAGASCSAGEPGPSDDNMVPRLILADVETGIGVGFTMFQNQYTDMHLFKMYGDQVYEVSAILGSADGSGWD